MLLNVILALSPIILIFILLLYCNMGVEKAGVLGLAVAVVLAMFYFQTDFTVIIKAIASGAIASFPIAFITAGSIFQVTVMEASGALERIADEMKRVSPQNKAIQLLIINMAIGTLLTGLGASSLSLLPPILIAMGYTSMVAILLPCIGYNAFCIYALMGVPAITFASFVNLPLNDVAMLFAQFMPLLAVLVSLAMLFIAGGLQMLKAGFIPAVVVGLIGGATAIVMAKLQLLSITGLAVGLVSCIVLIAYLYLTKSEIFNNTATDKKYKLSTLHSLSPWILITILAILFSVPFLPIYNLTFNVLAMPVEIIPNAPEKMRIFWQPWFLVIVSTFLAVPFLKISRKDFASSTKKAMNRSIKPVIAAMSLFALAYVMNHSGKNADFSLVSENSNMIRVLAIFAADSFGTVYVAIAPFLGYLANFVSGSQTSAIAMFTHLHIFTAEKLSLDPVLIACVSALGAGLASVAAPSKLLGSAASIDKASDVNKVLPMALGVSVVLTSILAIYTVVFYL